MTMAAAQNLLKLNPGMTFIYVSGAGTDSTEHGRTMWARVKGQVKNALLRMPFKAAYMFRPGFIQPLHGIISKTKLYRAFYAVTGPIFPLLRRFPKCVTTTEQLGRAMLEVAQRGYPRPILRAWISTLFEARGRVSLAHCSRMSWYKQCSRSELPSRIPRRSMTARDLRLMTAVNETIFGRLQPLETAVGAGDPERDRGGGGGFGGKPSLMKRGRAHSNVASLRSKSVRVIRQRLPPVKNGSSVTSRCA